jgi:hypothetical protein
MLSTKNISVNSGSGGSQWFLAPGNVTAKINSIYLEDYDFVPGAKHLMLNLEGKPEGDDFEGYYIDKDKPELGRHKGKIGRVKHNMYAYADAETKLGPINRDQEILKALKTLCVATGSEKWLEDQDEKHATIDSLVEAFNNEAPFADKYVDFCVCGREYVGKNGYTNHDLYLPRMAKKKVPYEKHGAKSGNLIEFDESLHIKKAEVKPVESFGDDSPAGNPAKKNVMKDFEL